MKLRDAVRCLKSAGFEEVGGGKHRKFRNNEGMMVTLPHSPKGDGLDGHLRHRIERLTSGQQLSKTTRGG